MMPDNNIEIINTRKAENESQAIPNADAEVAEKFSSLTTNTGTILSSSGTVTNNVNIYNYQDDKSRKKF